jgi:hypothetical protein
VSYSPAAVTLPASGLDLLTGDEVAGALHLPPGGLAVIRERTPRAARAATAG